MYHISIRLFDLSSSFLSAHHFTGLSHLLEIFPSLRTIILPTVRVDLSPFKLGKTTKAKVTVKVIAGSDAFTDETAETDEEKDRYTFPEEWEIEWRWNITITTDYRMDWSIRLRDARLSHGRYHDTGETLPEDRVERDRLVLPVPLKREIDHLYFDYPIDEPTFHAMMDKRAELGFGPILSIHTRLGNYQYARLAGYHRHGAKDLQLDIGDYQSSLLDIPEFFTQQDWGRLRGLRSLDIVVDDDSDLDYSNYAAAYAPKLDCPLNLASFTLRIRTREDAVDVNDWLQTPSSLAEAMVGVGGSACIYKVVLEHRETCCVEETAIENEDIGSDCLLQMSSEMYNRMVLKEIQKILIRQRGGVGWRLLKKGGLQ
jgi:hypothetical protein